MLPLSHHHRGLLGYWREREMESAWGTLGGEKEIPFLSLLFTSQGNLCRGERFYLVIAIRDQVSEVALCLCRLAAILPSQVSMHVNSFKKGVFNAKDWLKPMEKSYSAFFPFIFYIASCL